MPVTINDVARAARVSVATVSRALNGADNVLPATKQRILDIARDLRFTPSVAARSLITRRTDTIGALLPDLYGEYFSEFIRGIDQAARARGLHLLVSSSHGDASQAAAALRAMHGRVDGLLVMSPHADAQFLSHNLPANLPAVLVNTGMVLPGHAGFTVDNFGGAFAMTRHLATGGRKRIAFIAGPPGNHESQERQRGYQAALRTGMQTLLFEGDFTEEAGCAAGRRIAQAKPRPDAVFAANDMMAVGALAALAEAGLRVPEDVAVAGFDDIPIARYVSPALTTIRVPIAALGAAALEALSKAIDAKPSKPAKPSKHAATAAPPAPVEVKHKLSVLPVELIVRGSCGSGPPARPARPSSLASPPD